MTRFQQSGAVHRQRRAGSRNSATTPLERSARARPRRACRRSCLRAAFNCAKARSGFRSTVPLHRRTAVAVCAAGADGDRPAERQHPAPSAPGDLFLFGRHPARGCRLRPRGARSLEPPGGRPAAGDPVREGLALAGRSAQAVRRSRSSARTKPWSLRLRSRPSNRWSLNTSTRRTSPIEARLVATNSSLTSIWSSTSG